MGRKHQQPASATASTRRQPARPAAARRVAEQRQREHQLVRPRPAHRPGWACDTKPGTPNSTAKTPPRPAPIRHRHPLGADGLDQMPREATYMAGSSTLPVCSSGCRTCSSSSISRRRAPAVGRSRAAGCWSDGSEERKMSSPGACGTPARTSGQGASGHAADQVCARSGATRLRAPGTTPAQRPSCHRRNATWHAPARHPVRHERHALIEASRCATRHRQRALQHPGVLMRSRSASNPRAPAWAPGWPTVREMPRW